MTPIRFCVTLPGRSVAEARRQAEAAREDGADLAELRLDRWPPSEIERLGGLFPSPLPLVATYRSAAEGGAGSAEPEVRRPLLRRLRRLPFAYVDREVARDPAPRGEVARRSIGSRHLAAPVEWGGFADLAERGRALGEVRKTVAPATCAEFLGNLLPWAAASAGSEGDRVVHTTGPSGELSRAWAGRIGSSMVFCAPSTSEDGGAATREPSQVPVDRLSSAAKHDPPGPFYGLLGHPVRHSGSPDLHHHWLRDVHRDGAYLLLDVETEREFRDLLPMLAPGGFVGLNVTHPWKSLARQLADSAEPAADRAGAANCLTRVGSGWKAALTDTEAVLRRLRELRTAGDWDGGEFGLLGAGGAARATLVAAEMLGCRVRLWARSEPERERLHRLFPNVVRNPPRAPTGLLIHATSVGRDGAGSLEFPLESGLARDGYCLDFVYRPDRPEIRDRVRSMGGRYEDGERLLRYQAEESYRRWHGQRPGAPSPEVSP